MPSPGLSTVTFPCKGGLNLAASNEELLDLPQEAIILRNFEPSNAGGYRRINGYEQWGSGVIPGTGQIKGISTYKGGVVCARGDAIYHSFDGEDWIRLSKVTTVPESAGTMNQGAGYLLDASSTETVKFAVYTEGDKDHLYIATGDTNPLYALVTGTSTTDATYTFREVSLGTSLEGAREMVIFQDSVILANTSDNPTSLFYSSFAESDLTAAEVAAGKTVREKYDGSTSGEISVKRPVTGIRAHRDSLYVFTEKTISKVENIQDGNVVVKEVTEDVGCIDGDTIQEVGGDLVFLAADGLRTVSQTERFDDVELGVISRKIAPITDSILGNISNISFASAVVRKKNQYRLWYRNSGLPLASQRGIVASYILDSRTGQFTWDYSEMAGWVATAAYSGEDSNGIEFSVHGDDTGTVYEFEKGKNFDGSPMPWTFQMAFTHLGDKGLRTTVHRVEPTLVPEGLIDGQLEILYDYEGVDTFQPEAYSLTPQSRPAVYGESRYGDPLVFYGVSDFNRGDIPGEGSGFTVSIRISDTGQEDAPFSIDGYQLDYVKNGRI